MKKFMIGVAASLACLVGLGMVSEAKAHDRGSRARAGYGRPYYQDYGVRHGDAYYFQGRKHRHWDHRVWDSHHHRYQYWEPSLRAYYYYDGPRGGYYPCR